MKSSCRRRRPSEEFALLFALHTLLAEEICYFAFEGESVQARLQELQYTVTGGSKAFVVILYKEFGIKISEKLAQVESMSEHSGCKGNLLEKLYSTARRLKPRRLSWNSGKRGVAGYAMYAGYTKDGVAAIEPWNDR